MQEKKLVFILKGIALTILMAIPFFASAQATANKDALLVQADTLIAHADYNGALEMLNKIIGQSKPSSDADYQALYKRAFAYYGLGKFEDALTDVNQYIAKMPDEQAKLLRAYINQELEHYDDQLKDLNEFISANPANPDLIRWRASVYMQAERYQEAKRDIQQLLTYGANPELKAFLGLTYYYLNNPDSALTLFDEVITTTPEYPQTYLYATSLALEQSAYDLALRYADSGLKITANDPTLLFYKGIALIEKDDLDHGCKILSKAFQAGVDDAGDYLKSSCYGVH